MHASIPVLECGFESWLGLEFWGFCVLHFVKLATFFPGFLWFPPLLHWSRISSNEIKLRFFFFFFFFFCVPQLYLWGSPLLGEIFAYVTVF